MEETGENGLGCLACTGAEADQLPHTQGEEKPGPGARLGVSLFLGFLRHCDTSDSRLMVLGLNFYVGKGKKYPTTSECCFKGYTVGLQTL